MNIIKLAIAKTRRIKRLKNLRGALKSIHNKTQNRRRIKGMDEKNELVIIASSTQGNTKISSVDYSIKKMLDEWQIKNQIIFCGGGLTACSMREVEKPDQKIVSDSDKYNYSCISCNLRKDLEQQGCQEKNDSNIKYINFAEAYQNAIEIAKEDPLILCKEKYKGINVAEHARSSTIRYLGRPLQEDEEKNSGYIKSIYIEYLKSACAVIHVWDDLIINLKPTRIIINHGLYVPQGVILETAKKHNIPVSTWHLGYRKNTLLIAHEDTYHKTLIKRLDEKYLDESLTKDQEKILSSYMSARSTGKKDQISFVYKKGKSKKKILDSLKRKTKNKINFLVPTNVSWDAQSHFNMNCYRSMEEWIDEIIKLANNYEDTANFIFRCHPAEVTGKRKSRYSSSEYISNKTKASKNIYVIKPKDLISTYDLIEYCDAGIVYASKVGIEIAYSGKELIVCGEACIKCKGIARDIYKKEDLEQNIDDIIMGNKQMNQRRARKYAHHIFFKEMIEWARLENIDNHKDDLAVINRLLQGSFRE